MSPQHETAGAPPMPGATMSPAIPVTVTPVLKAEPSDLKPDGGWSLDFQNAMSQSYADVRMPAMDPAMYGMAPVPSDVNQPFLTPMPTPMPSWQPLDGMFPDPFSVEPSHNMHIPSAAAPLPSTLDTGLPSALDIFRGELDMKMITQPQMQQQMTGPPAKPQQPKRTKSREYIEARKAKILYDPVYNRTVAVAYACSACHKSKKKCVGGGIGKSCVSCTKRGCECKPRTDKRAHSSQQNKKQRRQRRSILSGINRKAAKSIRLPASILQKSFHSYPRHSAPVQMHSQYFKAEE